MDDLVLGQPPAGLRRPVLLAGFGGWGDAGSAASIAMRHVLGENPPPAAGMINPSACYDFTVARPLTTRREDGGWTLEYPKISFHPHLLAEASRDVLALLGPEPHFRWPEIAPAMVAFARQAGVEMVVTLGAYVGPVSHSNTAVARRTLSASLDQRLAEMGLKDTAYEGPTAFATALLHAAAAADLPSVSLWVATPPYLQAGNPVAALALLKAALQVADLAPHVDVERLQTAADTFVHDVDAALEEHPELAEQLKEMLEAASSDEEDAEEEASLRWGTPDPDRPPPDAPPGLPTGQALVDAVERYLRIGKKDTSGGGGGGDGAG